jgi:hypothetical protein
LASIGLAPWGFAMTTPWVPRDRTPWPLTCLLFLGGTVAAAQVGKAIVSLPIMRSELHFGIDVAGAILAVFATLGATCGLGGGCVGDMGRSPPGPHSRHGGDRDRQCMWSRGDRNGAFNGGTRH